MAELSPAIVKRTQDTLGKHIKKPTMTEKLLKKPPFRFLHDIITAVIRTTGYFEGLYTAEELQSENIKDREGKIAFLQKAIDVVKLSANENIKARPAKIVAGLEPENTNEFLQAIGKAIERKINSNEAVAAVKNGTTAELEKSKKTATKSKTEKTKDTAPAGPAKKKTPIDSNKKGTAGNKIKGDDAKANVKNAAENKKSKAKPTKQGSVSKEDKPVEKPKKRAEKTTSEISLDDAKKDVVQLPAKPIEPPIDIKAAEPEVNAVEDKSAEPPPVVEPTEPVPPPENRDNDANDSIAVKSEEKPMLIKADSVEKSESSIPVKAVEIPVGSDANKEHKKQKETAKVREKRSPPLKPKHKPDDPPLSNGPLISKSSSIEVPMPKPVTALRSAAVRPVSARPSAPRRRDRNVKQITNHDSLMHDAVEPKKPEKRKNLMNEYEEGENIIITDIIQEAAAATNESDVIVDKIADGKQGHLVQQILDTQSAFMSNDADTKKNDTNTSTDDHARTSGTRNMSELRQTIQKLSLYITPLGKLMEYFQEDVDAMQIELLMWQNAYATASTEIKQEESQTESLLEQFNYQLAEVNNHIKEHTEQINATATNIIQNEEKIAKLIGTL